MGIWHGHEVSSTNETRCLPHFPWTRRSGVGSMLSYSILSPLVFILLAQLQYPSRLAAITEDALTGHRALLKRFLILPILNLSVGCFFHIVTRSIVTLRYTYSSSCVDSLRLPSRRLLALPQLPLLATRPRSSSVPTSTTLSSSSP